MEAGGAAELPSINGVPPEEREGLFLTMMARCEQLCDFSQAGVEQARKEQKRRELIDMAEYMSTSKEALNERTTGPFLRMIGANIFRALPGRVGGPAGRGGEEEEMFFEPAWPHLQVVYELLRRFVNEGGSGVDGEFVGRLVELFHSRDAREREYLKTILHRIYGKVMPLRAGIRRAVMNVFHRVVYETGGHEGIAELLEILGSIINGFAVPLKEEHKQLLRKGLLPLHIPGGLPHYHVQLSFCVTQFAEKDARLGVEIVQALLRHWPATHSRKEVLLLSEVEEVLELSDARGVELVVGDVFRRVGRCIESAHFQVADKALAYVSREGLGGVVRRHRATVVPLLVGPVQRNVERHWHEGVREHARRVRRVLCEMDGELYARCVRGCEREKGEAGRCAEERERRWGEVARMARMRGGGGARRKEGGGGGGAVEEGLSGRRAEHGLVDESTAAGDKAADE